MVPRACSAYVGPAKLKIQSVWMVRKGAQCRVSDSMEAESAMSRNNRLNRQLSDKLVLFPRCLRRHSACGPQEGLRTPSNFPKRRQGSIDKFDEGLKVDA